MNRILSSILKLLQNQKKGKQTMTTTTQPKKKDFNVFRYAYGQIFRGYLDSGKADTFVITNIHVREWKGVLNHWKKKQYIVDFKLGDTIQTACDLGIKGFHPELVDEKDLNDYAKGVLKKFIEETTKAA